MRKTALSIPVLLPDRVYDALRGLKRAARGGRAVDLLGDRDIEWSWVASRIPAGSGQALDFGCGEGFLGLIAAHRGFRVTAIDLGPIVWPYRHERLTFLQGDLLDLPLSEGGFDLVLNCSAIEHVGIPGRYGVTEGRSDGDLAAMTRLRGILKPGGTMLLTVPIGGDAVFPPWHRVYGAERLPRLLEGFVAEHREFWIKDMENRWIVSDEKHAFALSPEPRRYGLGCFVLRRG